MRSVFVFLLLITVASAKVFERCDWAHKLKANGMDGYGGVSLANCEYSLLLKQSKVINPGWSPK